MRKQSKAKTFTRLSSPNKISSQPATNDLMFYEVEIIDKDAEVKYQIDRAAEQGICVLKKWQFMVLGNFVIIVLVGLFCAVSLALNITKDTGYIPLGFNETCTVGSTDCDTTSDLVCKNGVCACNSNKYWNSSSFTCFCPDNNYWDGFVCFKNKNFTESCSATIPCMSYLECVNSTCQCNYTRYFQNNNCVQKLPYNSVCTNYFECQDYNGVTCSSTSLRCVCSPNYYATGGVCIKKQGNGTSCTTSIVCDDTLGLSCLSGLCVCNSSMYFDGTQCQFLKSYDNPCGATFECMPWQNLICQTILNACNCPTISRIGNCDCQSTHFWDNTICSTRLSINGSCAFNYMCRSGVGLSCSSGSCVCTLPQIWNGANQRCQ